MSNGNDWITTILAQAKKDRPLLTSSVLTRMDTLLRRKFTQRRITKTDVTALAKQLITEMIPPRKVTVSEQ